MTHGDVNVNLIDLIKGIEKFLVKRKIDWSFRENEIFNRIISSQIEKIFLEECMKRWSPTLFSKDQLNSLLCFYDLTISQIVLNTKETLSILDKKYHTLVEFKKNLIEKLHLNTNNIYEVSGSDMFEARHVFYSFNLGSTSMNHHRFINGEGLLTINVLYRSDNTSRLNFPDHTEYFDTWITLEQLNKMKAFL